jgi:hypothetical protein
MGFSVRASRKNKMPSAIRAIDRVIFGHGQKNAWMTIGLPAIAIKLCGSNANGFGWVLGSHGINSDWLK